MYICKHIYIFIYIYIFKCLYVKKYIEIIYFFNSLFAYEDIFLSMIDNTHVMLKEEESGPQNTATMAKWRNCCLSLRRKKKKLVCSDVTWEVAINKVQLLMIRARAMTSVITIESSAPANRSQRLLLSNANHSILTNKI